MMSWEIARVADHLKRQSARLCGGEGPRLPSLFLFTDGAREPDPLRAIARLPRGSGVVYRPYTHQAPQALGERVAAACREAGHVLLVGRDARLALKLQADGLHHPSWDAASTHPIPTTLRHRWLVTAA
ncbi:MAG: thiamine monophosphate synthase, partial [Pseudomonadota bacterium]